MKTESQFKHLLSPGRIGTLETRNRILMAGMGTNFGALDGHVTDRTKRYYEVRAEGGAGIIVVEVTAIDYPNGAATPGQLGLSRDEFVPGLKELTDAIHRHGTKASIQLHHAAKNAVMDIAAGRAMLVPSVPSSAVGGMEDLTPQETQSMVKNLTTESAGLHYHEMTTGDIAQLVEKYADAADRANRAGFDAVEIHAGHGYIISMFLSSAWNKRTDAYGGDIENRSRLLAEVIKAIKKKVGDDFPVWFRYDAKEFRIENGIRLDDACKTAQIAEAAGADAVHVSAYANPALGFAFTEAPLVHEPGGYLSFAEQVKKSVTIPVIAVGRIEPEVGNQVIQQGRADFIAMGRKLLADPELPKKLTEGRADEIRPCIYCYTCVGKIFLNESTCCAVNPSTGREADFEMTQASEVKKVLVVGAGPAGMEAARIAALRGHNVVLCEKEQYVGGTTFLSSVVNKENGKLVEYLATQIKKLSIDLQLGREVTPEFVKEFNPDIALLALGTKEEPPAIPGVDRDHVYSGSDLRQLLMGGDGDSRKKLSFIQRILVGGGRLMGITKDPASVHKLSKLWMPLGKRVVILGGSIVGVELAEFFVDRGRSVTVLEEKDYFASEMAIPRRWRVLHLLRERGVSLIGSVKVKEILEKEVAFVTGEGDERTIKADSVILAVGTVPNQDLFERVKPLVSEVYLLGDSKELGYIEGALADGVRIGKAI